MNLATFPQDNLVMFCREVITLGYEPIEVNPTTAAITVSTYAELLRVIRGTSGHVRWAYIDNTGHWNVWCYRDFSGIYE